MARKRSNGKTKADIPVAPKQLPPLNEPEVKYFSELVDASNSYAEVMKQKAQFEFVVKQLQVNRKKVQKDEITMPVSIVLIPKVMTYQENDKKKVLEMMDKYITNYVESIKGLNTQVEYRGETFVETGIRNREYLNRRFKDMKAKNIVPARVTIKDEDTIFEAELTELLTPKEKIAKKEEFKIAKNKAVEHNKALKNKK